MRTRLVLSKETLHTLNSPELIRVASAGKAVQNSVPVSMVPTCVTCPANGACTGTCSTVTGSVTRDEAANVNNPNG
jgi:radical SAM protein with 4Fe4S-binding SPASM domain